MVRRKPVTHETAKPLKTFHHHLSAPVDTAFLTFFRIVYGMTMLVYVWDLISRPRLGIKDLYIDPVFHFTWQGLEWIQPWPGAGMYIHFVVMLGLSVFVTLGFYYRIAAPLLCGCFGYVFLLEQTVYQNHYYLLLLISLLMAFLPAHRAFSVDIIRSPEIRSSMVPAWALWILRFQIGIPYFYGGLAKLNADWMHGLPMRALLKDKSAYPLIGPYVDQDWMVALFTWGSTAFDLLVVPLLLWRFTRKPAFLMAVAFHLTNAALFRIGIFPWLMIAGTTVFFSPNWPRSLWRSRRRNVFPAQQGLPLGWISSLRRKSAVAVLVLYVGIQLLMPFRHLMYPGNVDWTEEGTRFAWRMMLRGKFVRLVFYATHTNTGETTTVDTKPYLADYQTVRMLDPDMVLQFSQFLCRELTDSPDDQVEIRAVMLVSLNGRKPQLLIDPKTDLAAEHRSLFPKPWVLPLSEPLRDDPWTVPVHQWDMPSLDL